MARVIRLTEQEFSGLISDLIKMTIGGGNEEEEEEEEENDD